MTTVAGPLADWRAPLARRAAEAGPETPRPREAVGAPSIAHVVFDFDGGGMETLVASMARHFGDMGLRVSVLPLSGREGRLGGAMRPHLSALVPLRPRPVVSMLFPRSVVRTLRQLRADVVHLHSGSWYKGALAARLAGVRRIVYTEHGREHHDPLLARTVDRVAARLTDHVVAVSARLGGYLVRELGVRRAALHVVPNGVNTARFVRTPEAAVVRRQLGIDEAALVIGTIGRLEPVKAQERIVRAIAHVRALGLTRPVAAVIWGDGSRREPLAQLARSLGVGDLVHFPGWTTDAVQAHGALDVFVLPSLSEGASMSLLEAMACEAVPLVTPVGASAEMLGPDLQHLVLRGEHPEVEIAEAIATFATGGQLRATGHRARERVVGHFSEARMMAAYERLYRGQASTAAVP